MIRLVIVVLLICSAITRAEPPQRNATAHISVESKGPCSSNIVDNKGNIQIKCTVTKDLGPRTLALMNKLLQSGSDTNAKLDELLATLDARMPVLHGELIPAQDADPPTKCRATGTGDSLRIYLGSSLGVTDLGQVEVIRISDRDILSLTRVGQNLSVSAQVFSKDGRIVATIRDNRFDINPNNYFRIEHPDSHTLTVFDQFNIMVLSVRFLNANAVKILGVFPVAGEDAIRITDNELLVPHGRINTFCTHNSMTIFQY